MLVTYKIAINVINGEENRLNESKVCLSNWILKMSIEYVDILTRKFFRLFCLLLWFSIYGLYNEKSCIATYYRQSSTNIKKIILLIPVLLARDFSISRA